MTCITVDFIPDHAAKEQQGRSFIVSTEIDKCRLSKLGELLADI